MSRLPLFVDLAERNVVLVGGGPVAARRASTFLSHDAHLTVISAELCDELQVMLTRGDITWSQRVLTCATEIEPYLDDAWLVHIATGHDVLDADIDDVCRERRIWSIRAGEAAASTTHMAATTQAHTAAGRVTVAVHADGDPRTACSVRDQVRHQLDQGIVRIEWFRSRRQRQRSALSSTG